jgi:uncharacterized damage-inducible protein DinB
MDLLDRLLEHDHWATAQLLEHSRALTDAQLDQPFDIGHKTLRDTFEHMIGNIEGWTALMAAQPPDTQPDDHSLPALIERYERADAAFAALARRVRDEQRMDDTFSDFYNERMRFGGAILHVILHNAEHRTEVLHILERLGVPGPIEVDHALWDLTVRGA